MSDLKDKFEDAVYGDFMLRPSRSLGPTGKKLFYGGLLGAGALSNIFAVKAGIWPVAIFLDAALGGAAVAMTASTRSGREYQRVLVKGNDIEIRHFRPGFPKEAVTQIPSFMMQVETKCDHDGNCEKLLLKTRGKYYEIGNFLPPEEKEEMAGEIRAALSRQRAPVQHPENRL